jgi:hypothetical protein
VRTAPRPSGNRTVVEQLIRLFSLAFETHSSFWFPLERMIIGVSHRQWLMWRVQRRDRFRLHLFVSDASAGGTSRAEQASQEFTFFLMQLHQIVEKYLGLFQIKRIEAFGEPARTPEREPRGPHPACSDRAATPNLIH